MDYLITFIVGVALGAGGALYLRKRAAAALEASAKILGGGGPGEEGK